MSGTRSSLFTDPGVASAAGILARAIAADDPYKDLAHLGSAAHSISQANQTNMNTRAQEEAYAAADPSMRDTAEGTVRSDAAIIRAGLRAAPQVQSVAPGMVLALNTAQGITDPNRLSMLSFGAQRPWNQSIVGAREHESGETQRAGIHAGATVAAATGAARIAAAQREAESLRLPRRPGDVLPPADQPRWGIPAPRTTGGVADDGSTVPSQELPRGPFALPNDATVAGGATRFDNSGYFVARDGSIVPPTERRGPPTTVAQVVADEILNRGSVGRIADGTNTPGELALVAPGVASATIRADVTRDTVTQRANALTQRLANTPAGIRAQNVQRELDRQLAEPGVTPEQRQALLQAADAQLTLIDREAGANSGTAQGAQIRATSQEAIANLNNEAAMQRAQAQIDGMLQGRTLDAASRELIASEQRTLARELAGERTEAARAAAEQLAKNRIEQILLQNTGRADAARITADARTAAAGNRPAPTAAVREVEAQVRSEMANRLTGLSSADTERARAWVSDRAVWLQQSGANMSYEAAVQKAMDDLLGTEGVRTRTSGIMPWGDSATFPQQLPPPRGWLNRADIPPTVGAPGAAAQTPAPAATQAPPASGQGGFRTSGGQVIPEGATITQGGRRYIIRGGTPVQVE